MSKNPLTPQQQLQNFMMEVQELRRLHDQPYSKTKTGTAAII